MSRFIVMERSDRNCGGWGGYVKIAVVEVEDDWPGEPAMISERSRGVIRVVERWDRLYNGLTENCAAGRVRLEAAQLVERLNNPLDRIVSALDAA